MRALALTHVFPRDADDPSAPFLLTWAQALAEAGADVGVVAPHDAGLPPRRVVGGIPVRFVRYAPERLERLAYRGEMHRLALSPAGSALVAALLSALTRSARAQVRAGSPDVVHVHWWMPGAVVARLARLRTPVVCTVHGTDVGLVEAHPRLAALARWALGAADRVETVSTDLAERLQRATGRSVDAVNPMPLEPFWLDTSPAARTAEEGNALRILAVGRLVPEKGFADLVSAVALMEAPARLVLVGDGPQRSRLAAQADALGVALELSGRLTPAALRRAYREADVVAQPSHREGFGLAAAEALAAGAPVVATDSGGARDVLDARDLVSVGDVPALASRLAAVAADPDKARRAARAAADRVRDRLAPQAAAERTLAGWRAVTGGVPGR